MFKYLINICIYLIFSIILVNIVYPNQVMYNNYIEKNKDRIILDIDLSGTAFPRLSGNESSSDAFEIGLSNFMQGMSALYIDMTNEEIIEVIFNALDYVGNLLSRPTFNRNTFRVFYQGRCDPLRIITFSIERIGIIPELGGSAIFPGV